jgi:electron transfer flavoprotein beta subunit
MTDMRTDTDLQPLAVAKVFAKIFNDKKFNLILMGKQSIDDEYSQTGQILASILGIPSVTFSSKIEIAGDKESATVTREVDFGL